MTTEITPISAFNDNYIWALHNKEYVYIVDPGQAEPVHNFLKNNNLKLAGILITHHHMDHVGGLVELQNHYNVPAWGPDDDRISGKLTRVHEGDIIHLPELDTTLNVQFIPGHTLTHIGFYNDHWLFPGDTLFSLGCGRMFEGHPEMFVNTLNKIKSLPGKLKVYCGHEYTQSNRDFAQAVEPNSEALKLFSSQLDQTRSANKPSLPSTLALEKKLNPFLRTDETVIQQSVQIHCQTEANDSVSCFAALRKWKDDF